MIQRLYTITFGENTAITPVNNALSKALDHIQDLG
jgi:hypothetical protein